jgi:hypothetical protein
MSAKETDERPRTADLESHYEEVFDQRGHDLDFCLSNSVFLSSHQFYVLGAGLG